jgi:hypothetical protein
MSSMSAEPPHGRASSRPRGLQAQQPSMRPDQGDLHELHCSRRFVTKVTLAGTLIPEVP